MRFPCRLIVDPPQEGPWNMAVDEALLRSAVEQGTATLRFYRWSEPTLSLGYFQRFSDRERHHASRSCAIVRRSSGGGAILHDCELTYSLSLPASLPFSTGPDRLYSLMHDALVAVVNELLGQRSSRIAQICTSNAAPPGELFLCFQRRARGDVLLSDKRESENVWKIAGSAQRRRSGAVLQHGSVLLAQSPFAPELPGFFELTQRDLTSDVLIEQWTERILEALPISLQQEQLGPSEMRLAESLVAERFASSAWTNRR